MDKKDSFLDFSGQKLQFLPKVSLAAESLQADNNSLTSLCNLPESLLSLSAANNKFAFLSDLASQCPKLVCLNLSYNRLISIEGLKNCYFLEELILTNNYIGDDQIHELQNLKNIKILDVSQNHLRSRKFISILQGFDGIEQLLCSGNEFTEWIMKYSLEKLKQLILDRNNIALLSFQALFPALQRLSIKENQNLLIKNLENLPNLIELDISQTNTQEISSDLQSLKNLRVLYANNNSIPSIPLLNSLEVLSISNNHLSEFPFFPKLKELNISHNNVKNLPKFTSLFSADFSHNKLENLSSVSQCSGLEYLNASNNPLKNIKLCLQNLQHCKIRLLELTGVEIKNTVKLEFIREHPELLEFNKESMRMHSESSQRDQNLDVGSWDLLSKSRLFPSCASSITGLDRGTPIPQIRLDSMSREAPSCANSIARFNGDTSGKHKNTFNSIFSDIKPSSTMNASRYEEKLEPTGRFSIDFQGEIKEPAVKDAKNKENEQIRDFTKQDNIENRGCTRGKSEKPRNLIEEELGSDNNENIKKRRCRHRCKKHHRGSSSSINPEATIKITKNSTIPRNKLNSKEIKPNSSRRLQKNTTTMNNSKILEPSHVNLDYSTEDNSKVSTVNLSYLFVYSKTPPKPVLASEKNQTFVTSIATNSYEYTLLSELLKYEGYRVFHVNKTYTFSLHKQLVMQSHNLSMRRTNPNNYLLFHWADDRKMQRICNDSRGFSGSYSDKDTVWLSASIRNCSRKHSEMNYIILALADSEYLQRIENDIFQVTSLEKVVPVYLIEFT